MLFTVTKADVLCLLSVTDTCIYFSPDLLRTINICVINVSLLFSVSCSGHLGGEKSDIIQ